MRPHLMAEMGSGATRTASYAAPRPVQSRTDIERCSKEQRIPEKLRRVRFIRPRYFSTLNTALWIMPSAMQGAWPSCGKKMANSPGSTVTRLRGLTPGTLAISFSVS